MKLLISFNVCITLNEIALKTVIVCTQLMPNSFQTICLKPQSAIAMQIGICLL